MSSTKLLGLSLFAALVVGVAVPSLVPAQTRVYKNCWLVGSGLGGFKTSQCNSEEPGGVWARTYFTTGGEFSWCHYVGLENGAFNDANCTQGGGTAAFLLLRRGGLVVLVKGGAQTIKWKLAGATGTITCSHLKAKSPLITGGEPGILELNALEYTECVATTPTKCVVNSLGSPPGTIATTPLDAELVENSAKTEIEDLFLPQSGKKITNLLYLNKGTEVCALKSIEFPVEGTSLTLIDPQKTESEEQTLLWEPASKEYINGKGETKTAELRLGVEPMGITGTVSILADVEGRLEPFGVY